jgi:hypothetical protein
MAEVGSLWFGERKEAPRVLGPAGGESELWKASESLQNLQNWRRKHKERKKERKKNPKTLNRLPNL